MDVIIGIAIFVLGLGIYIIGSIFYPFLIGGAGYSATPRSRIIEALRLADLKNDEVFYDLGCGTGEVIFEASKLSGKVKGIEIEPIRWLISKLRARKAKVILGNFFKQDISEADVIFVYQYRGRINEKIAEKIKAETEIGTRIVSFYWPIENMELLKNQNEIFVYKT